MLQDWEQNLKVKVALQNIAGRFLHALLFVAMDQILNNTCVLCSSVRKIVCIYFVDTP